MEDTFEKSEVLSIIGKNIKQARLLKGLTQEVLGEKINKSTNFVSLVERGESGVSISTLVDICNTLEIDSSIIFNGLIYFADTDSVEYIAKSLEILKDEDRTIVNQLINYIINSKK